MRKGISYTWTPKEIKPIKPITGIEFCILLPKIFIFVIITLKLLILFGIFQMFNLRGLNNFISKPLLNLNEKVFSEIEYVIMVGIL